MIKLNPIALTLIILCLLSCKANNDNKVEIVNNSPQAQFASAQIRIALQGLETTTAQVTLRIDSALKEQAYTIKREIKNCSEWRR